MGNQRFSIVPSKAALDNTLSNSVFRTLSVLGVYGDGNGWCWPLQSTLAELRGVSRETINVHIKELKKKGYVNVHHQFDESGSQKGNKYQIKFDFDFEGGVGENLTGGVGENLTGGVGENLTHNAPSNDPINVISKKKKSSPTKWQHYPITQSLVYEGKPEALSTHKDLFATACILAHVCFEESDDLGKYLRFASKLQKYKRETTNRTADLIYFLYGNNESSWWYSQSYFGSKLKYKPNIGTINKTINKAYEWYKSNPLVQ